MQSANTAVDLPLMSSTSYASATMPLNMLAMGQNIGALGSQQRRVLQGHEILHTAMKQANEQDRIASMTSPARRLVKVVIVDPNENIPLDQCVLYSGEEKVTDATDQELFFEIDIKDILAKHNEKRVKLVDKKVKERTEHLEPAKIRDLKMVVVNIAQF